MHMLTAMRTLTAAARLLPSDAQGDERAALREGDFVRAINGLVTDRRP